MAVLTPERLAVLRRKSVFTSGEAALLCKVAPRTVSKWFDSGRLKGYRIPGSQDRRIPRENLLAFMTDHGLPTHGLGDGKRTRVMLVGLDERGPAVAAALPPDAFEPLVAADAFAAGAVIHQSPPDVAVVDCALGRQVALAVAKGVRAATPNAHLMALAYDDETNTAELRAAGFNEVLHQSSAGVSALVSLLQAAAQERRAL